MYLIFDIGGTKTRIARSDDGRAYHAPVKFDTPLQYKEGIQKIIDVGTRLAEGEIVEGLAGGIRGVLNREKTLMIQDPGKRLLDWGGRQLAHDLSHAFSDAPTLLENDSAIVGLGEATAGAGKGFSIVAYHTVSTGVGGARIVDGRVDVTSAGFEPGHQVLDIDRTILGPAIEPTLENLVSGTALEKRRGVKPYEISQDDAVWDELARVLGYGIKNTVTYWSPDVIVLGGSMVVGDPRILREDIVRHAKAALGESLPCPPIFDAALADEGGLYGALALLQKNK
ncbi:ROK family protein [Candidatus Kaiserbacteria bacterium]|nr:ROK family protein [Candidatus Kaiserbacteria bacterium]